MAAKEIIPSACSARLFTELPIHNVETESAKKQQDIRQSMLLISCNSFESLLL